MLGHYMYERTRFWS